MVERLRVLGGIAAALVAGTVGFAAVAADDAADSVPRIIFDTDMYTDYDDVGALAILHALADAGECEIAAIGCNTWGKGNRSVAACEVVNAYYGRGDLTVGCARHGGCEGAGASGHGLPRKYPQWVKHLVSTNAPLAVDVYREALRAAPDKSVVLCTVGFLNNVADLLRSDRELVARKVRLWACMACSYPKGKEYNSEKDAVASDQAFRSWPREIPIIWTDFQYGVDCYAGRAVAELPGKGNPVKDAFAGRLTPREKVVPGKSRDQLAGHPSWDETAVLIAVRGWEPYFNLERGRFEMVGDKGADRWVPDAASACGRVTEKLPKAEVGRVIDELMCRPPKSAGAVETDSLKPFPVTRPVAAELRDEHRAFQSAPSVTISRGGRLWCAWHTGVTAAEGSDNCMVVVTSGDGGRSWSKPLFSIDAEGLLRVLDPGLWTDPDGRVWLFYSQLYEFWDGRAGVWAMQPLDPEREDSEWTPARRLCDGYLKNKPLVARDGSWLLPVEFMHAEPFAVTGGRKPLKGPEAHPMPERITGANVYRSTDKGATVGFLGQAFVPKDDRDCPEHMLVEQADGRLRMLVRTGYGIGEAFSSDGGKTWTQVGPSKIRNPSARFFVGRLASGALLLVKNGPVEERIGRDRITAFVSDDDGATWTGGLVLDERKSVSYPDAVQGADGFIHVVHDRERTKAKEILHHVFTEADVRAGRLVTTGSRLKDIVNKAGATVPSARAFDFVRDGVCQVKFEGCACPAQVLATNEFFRIVKEVTGATPNPAATNLIRFVVDPSLGGSDTYEIREEGKDIVLAGNNERSTWFAMVDLLMQLGCRWYWQGKEGEYLPTPTKDLRLENYGRKTTAAFPWRALTSHANRERDLFFAHNRHNPQQPMAIDWGQTRRFGGHSFGLMFPPDCKSRKEYFAKYPEQWALVKGNRVPSNHCYTNPDTIRTFQAWILRYWAEHPEGELLGLGALDTPFYCQCPECAKTDPSTLFFTFANTIIAPAVKRYPQKRYEAIAYAFYSKVPKVKIDDHISISYCMYDRCYKHRLGSDCPVNPNALTMMKAWREATGHAPHVYGYHYDVFSDGTFSVPVAKILQDEIRWARDFGVRYWFTEFYGEHPNRKKPRSESGMMARRWSAWAASQLMWDPDVDLEALRADFCSHVFGAAAEMAEVQRLLENAWEGEGHLSYYFNTPSAIADSFVRDPVLVGRIDALFAAAEKKTSGDARAALEVETEKALWAKWRKLATGPSLAKRWTMAVPHSETAPKMDGTGDDPVWTKGVTEDVFVKRSGEPGPNRTEATLLRTDKALYLRFAAWHTGKVRQTKTQRDDDVYQDDGFELCLDPMNTRTDYYWICVNTLGTVQDALASIGMNIDLKWNGDFRVATKVYDDHWVIEAEFPYSLFGAPQKGKPWLMGLNRCGNWTNTSWTDGTVHCPNSFRTLIME